MKLINGKLLISDVAKALGIKTITMFYHLRTNPTLQAGCEKLTDKQTSPVLLSIGSVQIFLKQLKGTAKKVEMQNIIKLEQALGEIVDGNGYSD